MSLPDYDLRPADQGDRGYIVETWLQTYRGAPFAQKLPDWAYWSRFGHVGLVEHLLDHEVDVTVACLPSSPAFVYGWAAWSFGPAGPVLLPRRLHYVFVRHDFRRQGFGSLLLRSIDMGAGPIRATHLTTDGSRLLGRRPVELINPYRKEERERERQAS